MDIEKPTEQQLKQALAKMLPEKVKCNNRTTEEGERYCYLVWISRQYAGHDNLVISDTELLHLCLLVEETLNPAADKEMECNTPNVWRDYVTRLDADCYKNGGHSCVHATWQQRTMALAKVLGVEIV